MPSDAGGDRHWGCTTNTLTVAAVQAAPVLMDREATIGRVADLTHAAAREGAQLVVFGEAFVPGPPMWIDTARIWDGDEEWYRLLADHAVIVPGPAADALAAIARQVSVWLVVGVSEREGGTIYNTVLYFAPELQDRMGLPGARPGLAATLALVVEPCALGIAEQNDVLHYSHE